MDDDEDDEDNDDDDEEGDRSDAADGTREANQGREKQSKKEELGSVGYRYRLFDLGNNISLVVRCEVNGVLPPSSDADNASPQFVCIRALNEFDSRVGSPLFSFTPLNLRLCHLALFMICCLLFYS